MLPHEAAAVEGIRPEAMRSRLKHARSEIVRLMQSDKHLDAYLEGGVK